MMDFREAVEKALAMWFVARRQKVPKKAELQILLTLWAHNLKGFDPETIINATSKACGESEYPEIFHICEAARALTGDEGWLVKFNRMVELAKRRDGSLVRSPDSPERTVAMAMVGALLDIGPSNRTTLQAQFRDAYEAEAKRTRIVASGSLQLTQGDEHAHSIPSHNRRTLGPGRTSPVDTIGPAVGGAIGSG